MSTSDPQHQIVVNGLPRLTAATNADPRMEVSQPPPPLPAKYKGHLQFYGFHFIDDDIVKFASENFPKVVDKGFWACLRWFMQRLRFHSNYRGVHLEGAVADEDTTPPGVTVHTGPTGARQFGVIALTAWDIRAWARRPTALQVEVISKILGRKPSWYIDVNTPDMYDEFDDDFF